MNDTQTHTIQVPVEELAAWVTKMSRTYELFLTKPVDQRGLIATGMKELVVEISQVLK